ncbi:MAG TPA: ROK family protein [Ktedonobacterales bacterium]
MDERDVGWLAIAVDIGGTNTRVALVLPDSATTSPAQVNIVATFPTEQRYQEQIERLDAALAEAIHQAERLPETARIEGIGISLGGRIARDGAGVEIAPNLRDYERRSLVEEISARCGGLPVRVAHDAVCGLLAERSAGALVGVERCAYLTLSTGTGCAVHLESPSGAAGVTLSIELGHQLLDGNERVCLCGQTGCLETYTGGRQLALRYGQPIESLPDADLWQALSQKLSLGLVNLAHLTRVERVAIGGAIALNRPGLLSELRASVGDRLRNARLELVAAALGEQAPLIGAATLLRTPEAELLY